jgi:hypothetical protein
MVMGMVSSGIIVHRKTILNDDTKQQNQSPAVLWGFLLLEVAVDLKRCSSFRLPPSETKHKKQTPPTGSEVGAGLLFRGVI